MDRKEAIKIGDKFYGEMEVGQGLHRIYKEDKCAIKTLLSTAKLIETTVEIINKNISALIRAKNDPSHKTNPPKRGLECD